MSDLKTKAIKNLEDKMAGIDESSIRHQVLAQAKGFKTSWLDLGQALYSVWKDKLYKDWGYQDFEKYTAKELGIRKETALKLLRSYSFLEAKEPMYLRKEYVEDANAANVPTYEAVNALRLANNKKDIDKLDYEVLRKDVLEKGKDARDVRKNITALIKQREEFGPEEARLKNRLTKLRRLLGTIRALREEITISKLLPMKIIQETDKLIKHIEGEICTDHK